MYWPMPKRSILIPIDWPLISCKKAKVGVTPGIDFGSGAEGYLRFTYANSLEQIEEGMGRLQVYITQQGYKRFHDHPFG